MPRRQAPVHDVVDMAMGGTSAIFATFFTNPLEVVKTRMQLQGELKKRGQHVKFYRNVVHGLVTIWKYEGFLALQRGLPAMQGFQFMLNSFRLGIFRIAERRGYLTTADGHTSLPRAAVAAGIGGGLGSIAGTPFFLVKTRLQASAAKAIAVGHQHQHTSMTGAFNDIYKQEGIKGLFRGVQPQIPRGTVGSASQMMSFTFVKEQLKERGYFVQSPLMLSFIGANIGGAFMTICLNPFDVVATRLSNQAVDTKQGGKLYKGMIDCFYKMITTEGFLSLYKGMMPNYYRLGPHTVLLLVCWDELKILQNRYWGQSS